MEGSRPKIKKDRFNIEQNEKNGGKIEFNAHLVARVSDHWNATLVGFVFDFIVFPRAEEPGEKAHDAAENYPKDEEDQNW